MSWAKVVIWTPSTSTSNSNQKFGTFQEHQLNSNQKYAAAVISDKKK